MDLIEVTCWRCGRTTAQAADWPGLQLCLDCSRLRAGLEVGYGVGAPVGTWHPTVPRVRPGELGAPINRQCRRFKSSHQCRVCARWLEGEWSGADVAGRIDLQRQMDLGHCDRCHSQVCCAPAPAYRVVVPMRSWGLHERGRLPDLGRLIVLITMHDGVIGRTTYAMAEEIATATLVESVALRFALVDGRRGVALWWDWRWHGALLESGPGRITREHLEALITGAPWPPPPIVCPRCGATVRENADGSPRAHGPKRKCRGYWPSLMPCCYGNPVEGITR
jgi:hypothetical protein